MRTDKSNKHFLSLIIPVYKQENIIVKNLKAIKQALDQIRYDYEIIVVIDGMVDKSWEKVVSAKIDKVRVIAYRKNQGKAYAIRSGMKQAQGDYIMFIDSGMEIDPNSISMLLEHMEWYNADIIVGSKRHPASQVSYSWQRKILSYGYYYFIKFLFGINVKDTQAGVKVFKKQVLKRVLPRLVEKRFAGDLEMLVVAKISGFNRIYEAPIKLNYHLGGITSAATLHSIYSILWDTLAIWYRKNILRYYSVPRKR